MIDKSKFTTKKELFKYLVDNKKDIIDVKKSVVKHCNPINSLSNDNVTVKALETNHKDDISSGVIKRTIVGNTYNWLDSHDDVHLKNTFTVSLKQRGDRVKFYHDHINQLSAKIGEFDRVYEMEVLWKDLNKPYEGTTTILAGDADIIRDYNPSMFKQYLDGRIDQHSVGMYYITLSLGINDPEHEEEFKEWNKYSKFIANIEKAEEQGFAFFVKEAKLIEISAVTEGSNAITPTIDNKVNPSKDNLDKVDPSLDSQKLVSNKYKLKRLC